MSTDPVRRRNLLERWLLRLFHGGSQTEEVAVKEFVFKQPVQVGDLLSFYVDVERVGTTSITVTVEVFAERRPTDPHVVKVTEATLTYVAIDARGRPRPVPPR